MYKYPDSDIAMPYAKTLTALYYEAGRPVLWGASAYLAASQKQAGGVYVDKFKLHLGGSQEAARAQALSRLPPGVTAVDLAADYLRGIGAFALQEVSRHAKRPVHYSQVQFCVTVPAVWDQVARFNTRKAVQQAGLVKDDQAAGDNGGSPFPAVLALEPEASSVFCFNTDKTLKIPVNEPYLIVDCGGGTVDIVAHAHRVGTDGRVSLREVTAGTGDLYGGAFVDAEFHAYLARVFGPATMADFHSPRNTKQYLNFMAKWEQLKHTFKGNEEVELELDLPKLLRIAYKKLLAKEDADDDDGDDEADVLRLLPQDIKNMYNPVVTGILNLIESTLSRAELAACRHIMLVGGLSASMYVSDCVRREFAHRCNVIVPSKSAESILIGASLIGRCSDAFDSRAMKYSYGIAVAGRALPSDTSTFKRGGETFTPGRFDRFVTAGDIIHVDHVVKKRYTLTTGVSLVIPIYCCARANVDSVNDPDVRMVANINVPGLRSITSQNPPIITIAFYFGRALIEIIVTDESDPTCKETPFTENSHSLTRSFIQVQSGGARQMTRNKHQRLSNRLRVVVDLTGSGTTNQHRLARPALRM